MALVEEFREEWRSRIQTDSPKLSATDQGSIVSWLIGENEDRFTDLPPAQVSIARQAMDYRYRILQQRYLGVQQELAYRQLIQRLSSLFLIRSKIRTWVALSRDRRRTVMDVLQEVIQEMMQSDTYIRQQIAWIAKCTPNPRVRNSLMLASLEEYCLRPIRNQPLLVFRFVNYLRRTQRGGMTHVPTGELIRLVSEEIAPDDAENPVSLLDGQAVAQHQEARAFEEQQTLRTGVMQEFQDYLAEQVEPVAAQWLQLHLQGESQEAIAQALSLPIKQVYRLREKISYHAIRVFGFKHKPELVAAWLGTSLQDHSLGLTPDLWQQYWKTLSTFQQQILDSLKDGQTVDAIAKHHNLKTNQVMGEWSKLYLAAQELRSTS
jgi:DNA-directed RNA polymerase specialized sigma24 family protein